MNLTDSPHTRHHSLAHFNKLSSDTLSRRHENSVKEPPVILVVDDSMLELKLLSRILIENGYQAILAQSAINALKYLEINKPDLILLDIVMPKMDGITLCRKLKQEETTQIIPVIFITALSDTASKLKAFEVGGVDYITKPFIDQEVIARINVHIFLKKTLENLEKRSVTDELTGAFNRRFAYEILTKQIQIAKREQTGFVLCYVDIDNLKTINDRYGHFEGDKLIKTVVESFQRFIRPSDYLFRMGGDEFLLIFPKAELKDSDNMIERLRQKLNDEKKIKNHTIDFSFGCHEFKYSDTLSPEELINIVDFGMFKAKNKKKSEKQSEWCPRWDLNPESPA